MNRSNGIHWLWETRESEVQLSGGQQSRQFGGRRPLSKPLGASLPPANTSRKQEATTQLVRVTPRSRARKLDLCSQTQTQTEPNPNERRIRLELTNRVARRMLAKLRPREQTSKLGVRREQAGPPVEQPDVRTRATAGLCHYRRAPMANCCMSGRARRVPELVAVIIATGSEIRPTSRAARRAVPQAGRHLVS